MIPCPSRSKHPFWSAPIGSQLYLEIITPPDRELKGLRMAVYSMTKPVVYKLTVYYFSGHFDTMFCNKREAISVVKNEWMCFYKDRTRIEYIEHRPVDMGLFLSGDSSSSPQSLSPDTTPRPVEDTTPRTLTNDGARRPNSREWLSKRLSLPLRRTASVDSLSNSPRQLSPVSPSRNSAVSSSSDSSPTTSPSSSPRRFFLKWPTIGSREASPRSGQASPRCASPKALSRSGLFSELVEKTRERYATQPPSAAEE